MLTESLVPPQEKNNTYAAGALDQGTLGTLPPVCWFVSLAVKVSVVVRVTVVVATSGSVVNTEKLQLRPTIS